MWKPVQLLSWGTASNDRAVVNARTASIECSRRRVERAEVELYLAAQVTAAVPSSAGSDRRAAAAH